MTSASWYKVESHFENTGSQIYQYGFVLLVKLFMILKSVLCSEFEGNPAFFIVGYKVFFQKFFKATYFNNKIWQKKLPLKR